MWKWLRELIQEIDPWGWLVIIFKGVGWRLIRLLVEVLIRKIGK